MKFYRVRLITGGFGSLDTDPWEAWVLGTQFDSEDPDTDGLTDAAEYAIAVVKEDPAGNGYSLYFFNRAPYSRRDGESGSFVTTGDSVDGNTFGTIMGSSFMSMQLLALNLPIAVNPHQTL